MPPRSRSPWIVEARRTARRTGPLLAATAALVALASAGLGGGLTADGDLRPEAEDARPAAVGRFDRELDVTTFQRGSIHSHSARSDGDSPAAVVVEWYRENGYQFLALTDHNRFFDPERYRFAERSDFVLLSGEELSLAAEGRPVHVNAICTRHGIGGKNFDDRTSALRWAAAQVDAQGGVSIVNHPNFHWALDAEQIGAVPGLTLIEIYSGHPAARSAGDGARPSVDEMWHTLLARGSRLQPAAVDDAHTYWPNGQRRNVIKAYPGTGWVTTYASATNRDAICEALRRGDLYGSNGPELTRLRVTADTLSVWLDDDDAMVEFLGADPADHQASFVEPDDEADGRWVASYRLQGGERFVRARITASDGRQAWTRAFRVAP